MRNPVIETQLKQLGIQYEFVKDYAIQNIDWKEADANPARLGVKLDPNVTIDYACDMEAGADWMAILVRDTGTPLDQLINGRHTGAAMGLCKPERKVVDAYRFRHHDPVVIELLIRSSNVRNGRHVTRQEKLAHVAEMHRTAPHLTVKELAAHFAMKPNTVDDHLNTLAAEHRADSLGVGHTIRQLSMEMRRNLDTSLQVNNVFIAATQLVGKFPADLNGQAGREFVTAVQRASGSEARAIKLIRDRDKELMRLAEKRKGGKVKKNKPTKSTEFLGSITRFINQWPGSAEKVYLEGYTWAELDRLVGNWELGADHLIDLAARGKRISETMKENEAWAKDRGSLASDSDSPEP